MYGYVVAALDDKHFTATRVASIALYYVIRNTGQKFMNVNTSK